MIEPQNPHTHTPAAVLSVAAINGALDEQLEQLQRRYAVAIRAASKSAFELKLLEGRDDLHTHVIAQVRRQKAAAETRAAQLLRQIDALEARLEDE